MPAGVTIDIRGLSKTFCSMEAVRERCQSALVLFPIAVLAGVIGYVVAWRKDVT